MSVPSKKKFKERRRKGAPLIMSRSSKNGTPILKERRFSGILYWCDWGAPNGARTEWFPEHRFYSVFRAPLLLLS